MFGAFWYLFSIERETTCWQRACDHHTGCARYSLYCDYPNSGSNAFLNSSCPIQTPNTTLFNFGIFLDALQQGVVESTDFPEKLFYCFWWGLQNLRYKQLTPITHSPCDLLRACLVLIASWFWQLSWSKPPDKYVCLGDLFCGIHFHIRLGVILIPHRKYAGRSYNIVSGLFGHSIQAHEKITLELFFVG